MTNIGEDAILVNRFNNFVTNETKIMIHRFGMYEAHMEMRIL